MRMYRALRYFGGWAAFSRNLLWMFLTFHKQVSVIKTYRSPQTLLPPLPWSIFSPFLFDFLFLSTNSVIYFAYLSSSFVFSCVFTRVLLLLSMLPLFYRCNLRKSLYQKRLFLTKRYSMCDTQRTSPPCCPESKRRSWANFRSNYTTRNIFLAYILDLGLAKNIYIYNK